MTLLPPVWCDAEPARFDEAISAGRIKFLRQQIGDFIYVRVYEQEEIAEGRVLMSSRSPRVNFRMQPAWNSTRTMTLYGPPSISEQNHAVVSAMARFLDSI